MAIFYHTYTSIQYHYDGKMFLWLCGHISGYTYSFWIGHSKAFIVHKIHLQKIAGTKLGSRIGILMKISQQNAKT